MSAQTSIQWTDRTWNPVRGCSRVSPGCDNCYAMRVAHRFSNEVNGKPGPYNGLTVLRPKDAKRPGVDWSGRVHFIADALDEPLRWRKPQRIFVNSMSDLFHESVEDEQIAAVFGVMAACPQHTFQILTKRPRRAAAWFKWIASQHGDEGTLHPSVTCYLSLMRPARGALLEAFNARLRPPWPQGRPWPLPNVWLGVSAENQETYSERVPVLVHQCPAALHWVSAEPLLGPLKLGGTGHIHLGWLVVGGESGHGARPFEIDWARELLAESRESGIPAFVKQLGKLPRFNQTEGYTRVIGHQPTAFADRKGGDPEEWPADLRVREFPV